MQFQMCIFGWLCQFKDYQNQRNFFKKIHQTIFVENFSKNIEFRGKHKVQLHHHVTLHFFGKYFYLEKSDLTNFLHFFVDSIEQNSIGKN